jgi:NADH dehydrogenase FAD-containing subunit
MSTINSEGIANANILRQHFEEQSLNPQSSLKTVEHGQSIIIVGAGAFGSSLALELVSNYRDE